MVRQPVDILREVLLAAVVRVDCLVVEVLERDKQSMMIDLTQEVYESDEFLYIQNAFMSSDCSFHRNPAISHISSRFGRVLPCIDEQK